MVTLCLQFGLSPVHAPWAERGRGPSQRLNEHANWLFAIMLTEAQNLFQELVLLKSNAEIY